MGALLVVRRWRRGRTPGAAFALSLVGGSPPTDATVSTGSAAGVGGSTVSAPEAPHSVQYRWSFLRLCPMKHFIGGCGVRPFSPYLMPIWRPMATEARNATTRETNPLPSAARSRAAAVDPSRHRIMKRRGWQPDVKIDGCPQVAACRPRSVNPGVQRRTVPARSTTRSPARAQPACRGRGSGSHRDPDHVSLRWRGGQLGQTAVHI